MIRFLSEQAGVPEVRLLFLSMGVIPYVGSNHFVDVSELLQELN